MIQCARIAFGFAGIFDQDEAERIVEVTGYVDPATGEVIAKVAEASAKDVDLAVKAARKALESGPWARMDAADRGKLMFKLADLIEKNAEELAVLESYNCGKTKGYYFDQQCRANAFSNGR